MNTSFNKYKEKLVIKVSRMWDPFYNIGFIIKYEWSELMWDMLIVYGKMKVWQLLWDDQNGK